MAATGLLHSLILACLLWKVEAHQKREVPMEHLVVTIGHNFTLSCTINFNTGLNSSQLYFKFKDQIVPSSKYVVTSSKSIEIRKEGADTTDSGYYACFLHTGSNGLHHKIIKRYTVHVGYRPDPASHMTCVANNWESMDCDWCPEHEHKGVLWKLTWTIDVEQNIAQWHNCTKYVNKPGFSNCICHFCGYGHNPYDECLKQGSSDVDFKKHKVYLMRVVATDGKMISETKNFSVALTPELVKPSPVRDVRTYVNGSRSVLVTWKHPPRLEPDHFSLIYFVQYSSKWSSANKTKIFNTTEEHYQLTGLVPYTDYTISVRCKPIRGGYLSEPMMKMLSTDEDAPSQAVELGVGGFHMLCMSKRCQNYSVIIFWKRIPEKFRNGLISSYMFRYDSFPHESTLVTYTKPYFSHIIKGFHGYKAYNVSVIANTNAGPSPRANIFIDTFSNMPKFPSDIQMEYLVDNSGVNVMWRSPQDGVTGFTIHHCPGHRDKGCHGDIEHVAIPASAGRSVYSYVLRLRDARNRIYAMSSEKGRASSGMTTWKCVYHYFGAPGLPEFRFTHKQTERSLMVQWEPLRCGLRNRGRVIRYRLSWCQANPTQPCTEETALVDSNITQYLIKNLKPFAVYNVTMAAEGHIGFGGQSETLQFRVKPSKPGDTPLNLVIEDATSSNVTLSWAPCTQPNGPIIHHLIYIKDTVSGNVRVDESPGSQNRFVLSQLNGFTNYSIQIAACNEANCSEKSLDVSTITEIKAPAKISASHFVVQVKDTTRSQAQLMWSPPVPQNGPIGFYEVMVLREDSKNVKTYRVSPLKTFLPVNVSCVNGVVDVNFSVRAVTEDGKRLYRGDPSAPKTVVMCTATIGYSIVAVTVPFVILLITIIMACVFRKQLWAAYQDCCGKDIIKVPERQPKISMTLEVDVGDYETFSDSVSPPLPSDTLIPEDDESMDSLGGLTRMPQGLHSSPGSRMSLGSNMIHRDTSPLMSVSSCTTDDGASFVDANGHPVHINPDGFRGVKVHSPILNGNLNNHNKSGVIGPGNVRLSTASSELGYSQIGTKTASGYIVLPESSSQNTGMTFLSDSEQTDVLDESGSTKSLTDYSKLGLQSLSEPTKEDFMRDVPDSSEPPNKTSPLSGKLPSPVIDGSFTNCKSCKELDDKTDDKGILTNFTDGLVMPPESEVTIGRAEIQDPSINMKCPRAHELENSQTLNCEEKSLNLQDDRNLKTLDYVPVAAMTNGQVDSDEFSESAEEDFQFSGGQTDQTMSPHCHLDMDDQNIDSVDEQMTETVVDVSPSTSTEMLLKSRSPSEQRSGLCDEIAKNKSAASSAYNSRDSLNSCVTKSLSANSSLISSSSHSLLSEESSPTSGLCSKGSSMESMDNSPMKHAFPRALSRIIPGFGNKNNNNSNAVTGKCPIEMTDLDRQEPSEEEVNLRRKNDGYV